MIVVAGLYRSGSTWLYNAVRLLTGSYGCFYPNGYKYRDHVNPVVKVHKYYDSLEAEADVIVTSYRSIRHVINSMKRQEERGVSENYKNAGNHRDIAEFCEWVERWDASPKTKYTMEYEYMVEDPRQILVELDAVLGTNRNVDEVLEQLTALRAPRIGHDEITLLGETHDKFYEGS